MRVQFYWSVIRHDTHFSSYRHRSRRVKSLSGDQTPTRGPSLQLVQAFDFTDAHGRMVDKVSDLAGRFPVTNGAGIHHGAGSIAERTHLERRPIGAFPTSLPIRSQKVSVNGKEGWAFAAPAEIHAAIVDLLPAAVRDRIVSM